MYNKSLFIFRRDLRIPDNTGFIQALKQSKTVIPIFIFDPRQIDSKKNAFYSHNAVQFMIESLKDLENEFKKYKGKLYFFYGSPEKIVKQLIQQESIEAVFVNRDYTPFSIERDKTIEEVCKNNTIPLLSFGDLLLNEPDKVKKTDGSHYSVFTAFFKKSLSIPVKKPHTATPKNLYNKPIKIAKSSKILDTFLKKNNPLIASHGGHTEAIAILKTLATLKNYKQTHDIPSLPTTHLSAHLKFGTISIRQAYEFIVKHLGKNHPLITQLYWRDFFTHVAYNNPHIFGHAFHKKYNGLAWNNDKKLFKQWCEGKTGFPIIDAGMRELNTTGFMHNRVRMIVASFLVKDLHINWQWGEHYFAQKLIDYDPSVNNGNWQWCASTGCDAQPYFRIFNPWIQQKKFDPKCIYIKKWIPELQSYELQIIHSLFKTQTPNIQNYPKPIVNHESESKYTKIIYKKR